MGGSEDGVVPRFRRPYTHRQCEQRGKLRAFHWSEEEIDAVLAEPDAITPTGKPAYGSDRVILGAMMLEASSFWPWPSLVPVWKDVLLGSDDTEGTEGYDAGRGEAGSGQHSPGHDGAGHEGAGHEGAGHEDALVAGIDPYYQPGRYQRPDLTKPESSSFPGGYAGGDSDPWGVADVLEGADDPFDPDRRRGPYYAPLPHDPVALGQSEPVVFTAAELAECGPPAVPIKPAGQGWMGLCQRLDAVPGDQVVLRTRSGPRLKTVRRVHAQWGDFALVYLRNTDAGTTLH